MKQELQVCTTCLDKIINKVSIEDLAILNTLVDHNSISNILSIDKTKILQNTTNLTDYKFQISIARLELAGLVDRNTFKRPNQFYITDSGIYVYRKYQDITKQALNKLNKEKRSR